MKATMKKTLCAIGLCAVTAGGLLTFGRYLLRAQPAPAPASVPAASGEAEAESSTLESAMEKLDALAQNGETLTDAEMEELLDSILNGEQTPTQEEDASAEAPTDAAQSTASASTAPTDKTSTSSSGAGSSSAATAPAASDSAHGTHSTASSTQTPARNSCDEQLAKLIAQLYVQQDRYERELLEIIRQAHQEYVAYPEEERSLFLKVQVVLGKTGALTELEKECDAEVDSICTQMETLLKENGRDTAIAKEARKTYNQKKSELQKELVRQTYSGGDGSGSAGHWLYDRLGE